MANLNDLQQRLAVASERNRQNNEQRAALLAEAEMATRLEAKLRDGLTAATTAP